jgi:hydrogenase-1 operon protein HyaE
MSLDTPPSGLAEFVSGIRPPAAGDVPAVIEQLAAGHGAQWVDESNLSDWQAGPGDRVLFFSGDAVRFPECLDVAVVLPELRRGAPRPFEIGVVRRECEDAIARRFASQRWPALVFLRDGGYVGVLPGMHDWDIYVAEVRKLLALPVTRVPGVGIPLVAAGAAPGTSCH